MAALVRAIADEVFADAPLPPRAQPFGGAGAGSLAAGRAVGYLQMTVAFAGLIISLLTGIPMIEWSLSNWARMTDPLSDSTGLLLELWQHAHWPLAGIGLFVIGILWAAATGLQLLAKAPREGVPPRR